LQALVDDGKFQWEKKLPANCRGEIRWDLYYDALMRYGVANKNNCNVPQNVSFPLMDGTMVKLGMWLNKQRKDKRAGSLLPCRHEKLQVLVDLGKLKWNVHFNKDDEPTSLLKQHFSRNQAVSERSSSAGGTSSELDTKVTNSSFNESQDDYFDNSEELKEVSSGSGSSKQFYELCNLSSELLAPEEKRRKIS